MVIEKGGKDKLGRSFEEWRNVTRNKGGEEYPTNSKKKDGNWIDHILGRNCFLKHVIDERYKVTGK